MPRVSVRDLVFILFKRKWSILSILLATLVGATVWIGIIRDDLYQVSAKVLVKLGQEQATPPTVLGGPPTVIAYRRADVNSEVDIIQSTEVLGQVVDLLGLDKPAPPGPAPAELIPRIRQRLGARAQGSKAWFNEALINLGFRVRLAPREAAIALLQDGLSVRAPRESNIVVVELLVGTREGASVILNTLLDVYQRFRVKLHQDPGAVPFFEAEASDAGERLREAEAELQRFEAGGGITALQKQKEVLLGQIAEAQSLVNQAKLDLDEATAKVQRFEPEVKKGEPNFAALGAFKRDAFPHTLLLQLADLQKERERLRMTDLDGGLRIQNNRSQFELLLGMLMSNLRSVRAEAQAEYWARIATADALQARVRALHGREAQWTALKRKIKVLEEAYIFYRKKLEESSADATLRGRNIGNVVVAERAMDPFQAVGARKSTLLSLAAVMAVLAALAWVAVAEAFDYGAYTATALEEFMGAPVIAVVPAAGGRFIAAAIGAVGIGSGRGDGRATAGD
ncbi:MAG: hypothetical protein HYV93_17740 [Candidatus Rokubacteria bacterium]|nr:hypothetical protein [Candidatus Rokubacteria bacterium]